MNESKVKELIVSLYDVLKATVKKFIEDGILYQAEFERIPAINFLYMGGTVTYNEDWDNVEYYTLNMWNNKNLISCLDHEVKSKSEYKELIKQLAQDLDCSEEEADQNAVHRFAQNLLEFLPNRTEDENIEEWIDTFITDLKRLKDPKIPIDYEVTLGLGDLALPDEEIVFDDNFFMRRPTKEDLEIVRRKTNYNPLIDKPIGSNRFSITTFIEFIISVEKDGDPTRPITPFEIVKKIEAIRGCFSIYWFTNVTLIYQDINANSILDQNFKERAPTASSDYDRNKLEPHDFSRMMHLIKEDEVEELKSFIAHFYPLIESISDKSYLDGNPLEIAYHRYIDSIGRTTIKAYKILHAVQSLEALLGDAKGELVYKMRIRTAGILRHLGFDSIEVMNNMRDAYNLRSAIVHGNSMRDHMEFARENHFHIMDYARLVLLVFLQLSEIKKKNDLIMLLNHSFVDEKSFEELKNMIRDNVKLPKMLKPIKQDTNP